MKPVSLSLKIKSADGASFRQSSENTISFQEKEYVFSQILHDEIPQEALESYYGSSSTLILIGPTGSGKTTSLHQILAHHSNLAADIYCTACEVNQNRSFVDLLGASASKKYLTSVSLDRQLKKVKLTDATMTKLITQRASGPTASNPQSSRSCLIVNLYVNSHVFTVVDMMGNEKYDASTSNTFANSNVSSLTQQLLSGIQHRSHNLVTNLILRRFPSSNIHFLLHLDQDGNTNLIKSSLTNIANAVRSFKLGQNSGTAASASTRNLPHYAQPTVSSSSPSKRFFASRFKVTKPSRKLPFGSFKTLSESKYTRFSSPIKMSSSHSKDVLYDLETENSELKVKLHTLQDQFRYSVEMFQAQIGDIRGGALSELSSSLTSIKADFEQLSSQNIKQREIISSLEIALKEASSQSAQKSQHLETLKTTKDSEIESLQSLLQNLKQESAKYEADLKLAQQDVRSKQAEIEQISQSQKDAESRAAEVAKDRDEKVAELQQTQKVVEAKLSESQELQNKKNTALEESEKELARAVSEVKNLEQKLQSFTEENAGHESEIRNLKEQVEVLTQKLSGLPDEAELKEKAETISSLTAQLDKLKQQSNDQKISWRNLNSNLKEENDKLKQQMESQASSLREIDTLRSRNTHLDSVVRELRQELESNQSQRSEVARLQEELKRFKEAELPKRYDYPELDFTNMNNSFPAIEIFDDQNDMTMFRRPVGSRTPSPAKVLRESNIRSSSEFKKKPLHPHPVRLSQSSLEG